MLYEIRCSEFKSYGKPRPPIRFHQGLNTVFGGKAADNSVGKSTFMLIIDYVFGGDTYRTSDAARHIGNHTIEFAFKFDDGMHYYSRDIVNGGEVNICGEDYSVHETIKLDDFRKQLFDLYNINLPYATFRGVVNRYLRIFGKDNYSSQKPLDSFSGEKAVDAITALEKLFNVYWKVEQYRTALKLKDERKKHMQRPASWNFYLMPPQHKRGIKRMKKKLRRWKHSLLNLWHKRIVTFRRKNYPMQTKHQKSRGRLLHLSVKEAA